MQQELSKVHCTSFETPLLESPLVYTLLRQQFRMSKSLFILISVKQLDYELF